jgi:hypothetical protein
VIFVLTKDDSDFTFAAALPNKVLTLFSFVISLSLFFIAFLGVSQQDETRRRKTKQNSYRGSSKTQRHTSRGEISSASKESALYSLRTTYVTFLFLFPRRPLPWPKPKSKPKLSAYL